MNSILGNIYGWFQTLFGQYISYYLWGYDPVTQAYTNPNLYNHIGLITIVISLCLVVFYYYIFDHPRFCKCWSWLILLGINCGIGLISGYGFVASKYNHGFIPQQLMYQFDSDGNIIAYLIGNSDCWGFGIANLIVSAMCLILFTLLIKWWSRNSKYVPF